jgi:hypothetical protein
VRRLLVAVGGAALLVAVLATAKPVVSVRISKIRCYAPCDITATVLFERSDGNRLLRITATGDAYYSSGDEDLDGSDELSFRIREFRRLPAGRYVFAAHLARSDRKVYSASMAACVQGASETCD